jgi:hypothetical protein
MATIIALPPRGLPWSPREWSVLTDIRCAFDERELPTNCEHGTTDEGDPWTAFHEAQQGSLVATIAKDGRTYVFVWADQSSACALDMSNVVEVVRRSIAQHALPGRRGR